MTKHKHPTLTYSDIRETIDATENTHPDTHVLQVPPALIPDIKRLMRTDNIGIVHGLLNVDYMPTLFGYEVAIQGDALDVVPKGARDDN